MRIAIDQQGLHLLATLGAGLPEAIAQLQRESNQSALPWSAFAWRNTLGQLVVGLARDPYLDYLVRHADLALQREAVMLAINARQQGVPPSELAGWLARQPLSALAQGRIAWEPEGSVLSARTWQSEFAPAAGARRRSAIRIVWPATL
jgi:hypothetical protein